MNRIWLLRLVVLSASCWLPVGAKADNWVALTPDPGYEISWKTTPTAHGFFATPHTDRPGWSPLDRWFQVAPGGKALAIWTDSRGLSVFSASGTELFRRTGNITAFRFSPAGDRLAFASARGIEILSILSRESRVLAPLPGVDMLRWTDPGLVARTAAQLFLVDFGGSLRTLAHIQSGAIVVAANGRLVYSDGPSLRTLDLTKGGVAADIKLDRAEAVINAELSPDGSKLLFASSKRVFLMEGAGPPKALAQASDVRSLCFSPDGASYLWSAGGANDAVVRDGKTITLPSGVRSVRFSQSGKVVLTMQDGVFVFDPATGARSIAGGISSDDGINLAGDLVGEEGVVAIYYRKSSRQKETQTPKFPGR